MKIKRLVVCLMAGILICSCFSVDAQAATKRKKSYNNYQLKLLSSIIYCESGWEPYSGKLAVGIVIVNRVKSSAFPNTLKGVVYQPYQFSPARSGALKKAMKEYDAGRFNSKNEKACIKAAKAALNGEKIVLYKGKKRNFRKYYFFNGNLSNAKCRIAGHEFK